VRSNGLIAMGLAKRDELIAVCLATDQDDVILVTRKGQAIRFPVSTLRVTSRIAGGVRGIRLSASDQLVSMDIAYPDTFVLAVTTNGFGKLSPIRGYPRQHRSGSGVRTFKLTPKTGDIAAARVASLSQQVMIVSAGGIVIQTPVQEKDPRQGITIQGRSAQGVRLMRLAEGDEVVAVACFDKEKEGKGQKAGEKAE
jgi:DNA gyrase subunit A